MSVLWKMALRNTIRNRRRTALTVLVVLVGVGMFVIAHGFVDGIDQTLIRQEIKVDHGHLRVLPSGYLEEEVYFPLDLNREGLVAAESQIQEMTSSATLLRRTAFSAEIGDGKDMIRCRGVSANLKEYSAMLEVGDMALPDGSGYSAFVGVDLAKIFSWKPGDYISVRTRTAKGSINALQDVEIVGLVASGHMSVDHNTFFVSHQTGRVLLDVEEDFFTELLVVFDDPDRAFSVESELKAHNSGIETQNWDQKTRNWRDLNKIRRKMFNFILAIILLIGASGIANTCLMSGFERRKEIGAMMALGLSRKKVVALFMMEAVVIGLMGAILGAALGGWYSHHLAEVGVPIPDMDLEEGAIPVPSVIYFHFSYGLIALSVGVGLVITLVSAIFPSLKCSAVDPVAALREE